MFSQIAFLTFRYQLEYASNQVSLQELEDAYQSSRGSETGFRYAQLLAVALNNAGRDEEAISVLNTALEEIPEVYAEIESDGEG